MPTHYTMGLYAAAGKRQVRELLYTNLAPKTMKTLKGGLSINTTLKFNAKAISVKPCVPLYRCIPYFLDGIKLR